MKKLVERRKQLWHCTCCFLKFWLAQPQNFKESAKSERIEDESGKGKKKTTQSNKKQDWKKI